MLSLPDLHRSKAGGVDIVGAKYQDNMYQAHANEKWYDAEQDDFIFLEKGVDSDLPPTYPE